MKILLAVSALCAAAICAILFPDMKKYLLIIPFALVALLASGCGSVADFKRKLRDLPDGHYDSVLISQKNLGVGGSLSAEKLVLSGNEISFDILTAEVNTPWTGTSLITVKGASMDVSPAARAKKAVPAAPPPPPAAPPVAPAPSPAVEPEAFNAKLPPTLPPAASAPVG
ncbi:MAG: hypothetical protein NTV51_13210 [Verrucomicrobia bacterium]|nr:hypothetical protein [Verrucomicrobiota bacterium]